MEPCKHRGCSAVCDKRKNFNFFPFLKIKNESGLNFQDDGMAARKRTTKNIKRHNFLLAAKAQ
jgi:hypothetical protein